MKGLIHIYCGDGKGKTTAALGLALRWAGCGMPVTLAQFQKNMPCGELNALEILPSVTVLRLDDDTEKFSWELDDDEKAVRTAAHNLLLEAAGRSCKRGERRLVILDELCSALECGLIDAEASMRFVREKPSEIELVITGRNPSEELCSMADYITEMRAVKHPMDSGVPARKGVEF